MAGPPFHIMGGLHIAGNVDVLETNAFVLEVGLRLPAIATGRGAEDNHSFLSFHSQLPLFNGISADLWEIPFPTPEVMPGGRTWTKSAMAAFFSPEVILLDETRQRPRHRAGIAKFAIRLDFRDGGRISLLAEKLDNQAKYPLLALSQWQADGIQECASSK